MSHVSPKQERSRRTLERILDAAEALLDDKPLDEITVRDVVQRAGSSVGSFYARFPGKDDLVAALLARYHEEALEELTRAAADEGWAGQGLEHVVQRFIAGVIAVCRRRRGLLRLRVQLRLSGDERLAQEPERDREAVGLVQALFPLDDPQIRHPDPQFAVAFALRIIDEVVGGAILAPEISGSYGELDDESLARETTRAVMAYLSGPG